MTERFAVITAAGSSRRMGTVDKLLLPVNGLPLVMRSLRCFLVDGQFRGVALSVSPSRVDEFRQLLVDHYPESQNIIVVKGGEQRQDSIRLSLVELESKFSPAPGATVLIHDGARPFISDSLIEALHNKLESCDGVIPATPVRDTIKRVDGNKVVTTEERDTLRLVQTPQAFRFSKILEAHHKALSEEFLGTDDASLMERMQGEVTWIDGPTYNLKITVPDDIVLLEEISRKLEPS